MFPKDQDFFYIIWKWNEKKREFRKHKNILDGNAFCNSLIRNSDGQMVPGRAITSWNFRSGASIDLFNPPDCGDLIDNYTSYIPADAFKQGLAMVAETANEAKKLIGILK